MAPPPKTADKQTVLWVWLILGGLLVVGVWGFWPSGDSSLVVETPANADSQQVVDSLTRASAAHGVCYGWSLQSSATKPLNVGSNLGVGKAVDADSDACPKYIEIVGDVRYSKTFDDSASWSFNSNIRGVPRPTSAQLDRIGASVKRLMDDPATVILLAAEALPLLAQEAGMVSADVPPASAPSTVVPVAKGGNDFWRDRWVLMTVTGGFLLVAVIALLLGIRSARQPAAPPKVAGQAPKVGQKPAGR